eukprot:3566694-Rhodomonas_salina.1
MGPGACLSCSAATYHNGLSSEGTCSSCPAGSSLPPSPGPQTTVELQCQSKDRDYYNNYDYYDEDYYYYDDDWVPSCETGVALPDSVLDVLVTVEVEMTDFGSSSEYITSLTIGGHP